MRAVILHAHADSDAAQRVARIASAYQPFIVPMRRDGAVISCGPQLIGIVLWSAAAAAERLDDRVADALRGRCGAIVWRLDDSDPPRGVDAALSLSPMASDASLLSALRAIQVRAETRSAPVARRSSAPATIVFGLLIGAVLGLGGVGLAAREEVAELREQRREIQLASPKPLRERPTLFVEPTRAPRVEEIVLALHQSDLQRAHCGHNVLQPVTVDLRKKPWWSTSYAQDEACPDGSAASDLG